MTWGLLRQGNQLWIPAMHAVFRDSFLHDQDDFIENMFPAEENGKLLFRKKEGIGLVIMKYKKLTIRKQLYTVAKDDGAEDLIP